jgi:hypothetical protein
MSQENLYILLKLSNSIMVGFQYLYIVLFAMVLLLKISKRKIAENISIKRFVREIIFSILLIIVLFFQNNIDISLLVFWMFITGLAIGVLHSFSFNLYFERGVFKMNSRYLISVLLGISVLLNQFSYLYMNNFMNISFILLSVFIGISIGLGFSMILRINHSN